MSLEDRFNRAYGNAPPRGPDQSKQADAYTAALKGAWNTPAVPTVPLAGPSRKVSKDVQEADRAIGPPASGLPSSKVLGPIAEWNVPKSANDAIGLWQKKDLDIRPTPAFARKVTQWANARTMEVLIDNGFVKEGRFTSNVSNDLIEGIRGGLMYVGAGMLGDITPQDAADASELALESYTAQVISRATAKGMEIISNHIDPVTGAGPRAASRDTLTEKGKVLVAEQDKIVNAAIQIRERRGEESVQGSFNSLLIASNARLQNETGADPEVVQRLKLSGRALGGTNPVPQDALRFVLSIQEDPSFIEKPLFSVDTLSNPGRLMSRTALVFRDINDKNFAERQITSHFDSQVNRARAKRIGGDPDLNHMGMLFHQFPGVAIEIADTKLKNEVLRELRSDQIAEPTVFESKLNEARRERLEPLMEDLAAQTRTLEEELITMEARETISFATDLETAIKSGVGNLFAATSEPGRNFRQAFLQKTGDQRVMRHNLGVALTAEASFEVMQVASEVVDEYLTNRTIAAAAPGTLRFVVGTSMGVNPVPIVEKHVPPEVIPLKNDFSNLRAVLISAQRAGHMPYSLRQQLFSDDPNDMVANAVTIASDVMAPGTILRMLNNGLSLAEVHKAFKQGQKFAIETKILPSIPGPDILIGETGLEALHAKEKAIIQSLGRLNPLERPTAGFGLSVALAQVRMERGWKEMASDFLQDPRAAFDTLAGVAPALVGGGVALTAVGSKIRAGVVNAGLHTRLRKALGNTARFDPAAVHAARKKVGQVLAEIAAPGGSVSKKVGKRQETYRALAAVLDQMDHEHSRGTLGAALEGGAPDAKRFTAATRQFKRTLRQLGPDEAKNLADGMGVPLQILQQVQERGSVTTQSVMRLAERAKEVFNIDGVSMPPWVARNGPKIAGKITDALEKGAAPDWETMPFSVDAAATTPNIYGRMAGALDKLRPGSKRIIDASGAYANQIAHWVTRKMDDTLGVRHLQARQRGNQVDFIESMERHYEGELFDLELAAPTATLKRKQDLNQGLDVEEELIVQGKDKLHERIRRAQRVRSTVDRRTWDTSVNIANEQVVADASDAHLILWGQQQGAAGDLHTFWTENRLANESFDAFNARTNRIMAGTAKPTDSVAGLRKSIARRYLNAPGLSTQNRFDTDSGIALNAAAAKQLRQRRRSVVTARARYERLQGEVESFGDTETPAAQKAFGAKKKALREARRKARFDDPEFHEEVLGANLGIRTEDLKTDYQALVRLTQSEDAVTSVGVIQRSQDMSDGRISTGVQMVRDAQESMLFTERAHGMQIENFSKRFNSMSPEKQALFNTVSAKAADSGDMRALRALGKKDEQIAGLLGDLDADKNLKVKQLLSETNHFRQNILRDMRNSGVIDDAEFDSLVGGYAAHVYSSGKHRELLGLQFDSKVFGSTTEGGLDLSELLRQKHFEKHKVIVSVRGGRSNTHLFDTEAEAKDFLGVEYGMRGKFKSAGEGIVEGKTNLGDPVAILPPLGLERAKNKGFLGEGPALFSRLDTLVRDMHQASLMKTMDRPGWRYTPEEFAKLANGKDGLRFRNQFEQLGDTPDNGPLRGAFVHKNVAKMVDRMAKATRQTTWIAKQMLKFGEEAGIMGKALVGAPLVLAVTAKKLKDAIITNKIARSIQTTSFNFLMDSEMFGTTAAGRDFSLLHPGGLANKRLAMGDLMGQLRGDLARPEFIDAVGRGVLDDGMVSHNINPNLQRTMREGYFGKVSRLKHLGNESVKFLQGILGEDATLAKAVDHMIGGTDDPRINKLRARYDEIHALQKRPDAIHPGDATAMSDEKLSIAAILEREEVSLGNSFRRGARAINQILVGDGKTGLFNDMDELSREFYGRVSNSNRLGAYYHLLEKGIAPDEAVKRLNLFMQNYSRVPEALRDIGRSPFGSPVVSFPYEMMRIMGNMLRYQPETLMGYMGGLSAANFMSMVGGGLDPYRVQAGMASDSAGFPGWLSTASSLIIPHAGGSWSTLQVPALNFWQVGREPFGIQSQIFGLDDSPGLSIGEVTTNIASKFFLGNPLTTLAYAGIQRRDPKTGQKLSETDSFMGRAAEQIRDIFMPPELPFVGSIANDVAEGIEKPKYMRSGREIAPAQRAIQSIIGVRLRGAIGSGKLLGPIGDSMSKMLGVQAWTDLPVSSGPLPGFGDRDILSLLFVDSRLVDPENARNERMLDVPYTKVRKARDLLASGDPVKIKLGRALRDEALKLYEEQLTPFHDFHGREIKRNRTEQEKAQLLTRAYNTQDYESQFDRLSVSRKASILVGATMTGVNVATFRDLAERTIAQDGGQLRAYSSLASIRDAIALLDSHLKDAPTNIGIEELSEVRSYIAGFEEKAQFKFEVKQETDAAMRAAAQLFFEGNTNGN